MHINHTTIKNAAQEMNFLSHPWRHAETSVFQLALWCYLIAKLLIIMYSEHLNNLELNDDVDERSYAPISIGCLAGLVPENRPHFSTNPSLSFPLSPYREACSLQERLFSSRRLTASATRNFHQTCSKRAQSCVRAHVSQKGKGSYRVHQWLS